ncbi:hypothetical protein Tco_0123101 [Tanacetum coccineum]
MLCLFLLGNRGFIVLLSLAWRFLDFVGFSGPGATRAGGSGCSSDLILSGGGGNDKGSAAANSVMHPCLQIVSRKERPRARIVAGSSIGSSSSSSEATVIFHGLDLIIGQTCSNVDDET